MKPAYVTGMGTGWTSPTHAIPMCHPKHRARWCRAQDSVGLETVRLDHTGLETAWGSRWWGSRWHRARWHEAQDGAGQDGTGQESVGLKTAWGRRWHKTRWHRVGDSGGRGESKSLTVELWQTTLPTLSVGTGG